MALALTYSTVDDNVIGAKRARTVSIVPDSSYAIGGESFLPADVGYVVIDRVIFLGPAVDPDTVDNAVIPHYDKANGKIQFFWDNESGSNSSLVEVDDTTSLAAYTAVCLVIGY